MPNLGPTQEQAEAMARKLNEHREAREAKQRQLETQQRMKSKKQIEAEERASVSEQTLIESLGEDDRYNILSVYKQGLDRLVELGSARAHGHHLILKGLTDDYIQRGAKETIELGGESATDIRQAPVFEISAAGPEVPRDFEKGHHCRPISAALDPLGPAKKTTYVMAHSDDVPISWDIELLAEALRKDPKSAVNARKLANGQMTEEELEGG